MKKRVTIILLCFLKVFYSSAFPLQKEDSVLHNATLKACIEYALKHEPSVNQAQIDEEIAETTIKSKLADWFPQINVNYTQQRYLLQPTAIFPDFNNPALGKIEVKTGTQNLGTLHLSLDQTIFNRDVLLAARTAKDVRSLVQKSTTNSKINVAAYVSKAYYDVLLTEQQIKVFSEIITRLEKSLKDAFYQYKSGITDNIDYKRATIALNNSKADKKNSIELLDAKYTYLKQLMGYSANAPLNLSYDTTQMENEAYIDTLLKVNYEKRIEYQQLQDQNRLLNAELKYNKWAYLPSLSFFADYNLVYQNDSFQDLYSRYFPNTLIGLSFDLPIFQGGKRAQEIKQAKWQIKRNEWDIINLKNSINSQYSQALAAYKGNLNYFLALKQNLELAQDVYNTVQLQYRAGVKTYLEVIVSETDLRTAKINYYNSLYQLLASKTDVEKALGILEY
ncbi:TolC family protein [Solitalea koreensis]|uniref:Outer membrane protein TolC n=1 Tax=Solitalea koreensis TaxID=543615 RepID=A0A521D1J1_9SPHI|nr:TolC family protein [Solitalea koreensis]SMO64871.1 Outer membrane protein TolC [Solitalea koreensis]